MQEEMKIVTIDGQPWYVSSSGWKHPFVGGGAGEEPPAALDDAETADPATETTTEAAPETFTREYVENLRKESAGYRTKAKDYEDAFQGYDDASRTELLTIAKQLSDPTTQPDVAKRLQAIAENILKGHEAGTPTTPTGDEDPDSKPMTRKEWKDLQAEQEDARRNEEGIKSLEAEARGLGIEPGSIEYAELLFIAQAPEISGDLVKSKAKLEEHWASKAKARAEEIAKKGERWPGAAGTAAGTGAADAEGGSPKTFKESRAAAMAYLSAKVGA